MSVNIEKLIDADLLNEYHQGLPASAKSGNYNDLTNKPNSYLVGDSASTDLADADYVPFYDTSASARKKSLWSNIKSKLKTYFDDYYSTVKTSKAAASGGTDVSLVTTGEKYTWNSKPSSDTKNTAGSTDSSSKLFLIGATSQAANPQTYSHDTAYVGTDGCLYSGSKKVLTDIATAAQIRAAIDAVR